MINHTSTFIFDNGHVASNLHFKRFNIGEMIEINKTGMTSREIYNRVSQMLRMLKSGKMSMKQFDNEVKNYPIKIYELALRNQ